MVNGTTHAKASQIDPMRAQPGLCADHPATALQFVLKLRPKRPRRTRSFAALPEKPAISAKPTLPAIPRRHGATAIDAPRLAFACMPATGRHRTRDECGELARALHDDLAQILSYALIQLDIAQASLPDAMPWRDAALRHSRDLIKDALRTTRDVIGGLQDIAQPTAPTFDAQCVLLAAEMGRLTRQPIDFDCAPITSTPPASVCKVLLRAARELLANACKHASGTRIVLTLRQETHQGVAWTVLTVCDSGPGFDPAVLRTDHRGHFGLRRLPAMLRHIGGAFTLDTRPGTGVRAQIRWAHATRT